MTFDNIMDCADEYSLPIQDFDWLSNSITTRGILVYSEAPTRNVPSDEDDLMILHRVIMMQYILASSN